MTRRLIAGLCLLVPFPVLPGCGKSEPSSPPVTPQDVLTEIGGMYQGYTRDHKKAPRKLSDFDHPYEPGAPNGYAALRDGSYVIYWGGSLPGPYGGSTILAHEKSVPEKGGFALFQNGTVKQVTAEEFKAAPKVGK